MELPLLVARTRESGSLIIAHCRTYVEMLTWGCLPLHFLTTSKKVSILHTTAIILLMKSHEVLLFSSQFMADEAGKRGGRSLPSL